jgi:prepilin-type N-terminal cleavage/methylation domain-containing protein
MDSQLLSSRCKKVTSTQNGFSLAELLVVVGIVGLLLSISLPVLSQLRDSGRSTVCLAKLRQIGQGIHSYAVANHGFIVTAGHLSLRATSTEPFEVSNTGWPMMTLPGNLASSGLAEQVRWCRETRQLICPSSLNERLSWSYSIVSILFDPADANRNYFSWFNKLSNVRDASAILIVEQGDWPTEIWSGRPREEALAFQTRNALIRSEHDLPNSRFGRHPWTPSNNQWIATNRHGSLRSNTMSFDGSALPRNLYKTPWTDYWDKSTKRINHHHSVRNRSLATSEW